jgi:hypothetical protein
MDWIIPCLGGRHYAMFALCSQAKDQQCRIPSVKYGVSNISRCLWGRISQTIWPAKDVFGQKEVGIHVVFDLDGQRVGSQHAVFHFDEERGAAPPLLLTAKNYIKDLSEEAAPLILNFRVRY